MLQYGGGGGGAVLSLTFQTSKFWEKKLGVTLPQNPLLNPLPIIFRGKLVHNSSQSLPLHWSESRLSRAAHSVPPLIMVCPRYNVDSIWSLAALPLHWIYNVEVLDKAVGGRSDPEFLPEPHCPFYHIATGRNSCYGHQAYVLLESLAECKGRLKIPKVF